MKKSILSFFVLLLLTGCGPKKSADETGSGKDPFNLKVEPDNHEMTISWTPHIDNLISGYNIYISERPLRKDYPGTNLPPDITPFNSSPFPGDTNPDDGIEHFYARGLENGVRYYVSVRVLFPDGTLSHPSTEIPVVCGARGEISLSIRYQSEQDGYSFEEDTYVRANASDNDLYFFSRDDTDYLCSPTRLDGFLRANRLLVLPFKGEIDDIRSKLAMFTLEVTADRVAVKKGDWILLRTPENRNALLKVLDFKGKGKDRTIWLFFTYSTLTTGELFF